MLYFYEGDKMDIKIDKMTVNDLEIIKDNLEEDYDNFGIIIYCYKN